MSDNSLTEEPLQFGEGGRLFGILTLPGVPHSDARNLPVFVFLNAGLLHRVGPYRLYVRLVRELADMGFSSLRVDLAGKGDSTGDSSLTNQQSVTADYQEIVGMLASRLGSVPLVLAGLCSGADNAIRLTLKEPRVLGLVLLDPICYPDDGFRTRATIVKYTSAARYRAWLKRRLKEWTTSSGNRDKPIDPLAFRDLPTLEQLRAAIQTICERGGRVLSVYTQYAYLQYYNQMGQLGRVVGVEGYQQYCTELFWPQVDHTYALELHRRRLIEEIKTWASSYIRP